MSGNGPLDFEATIDAKTFNSMLDEMERRIRGVTTTTERETSKIDDSFRKVAMAASAYFSVDFGARMTKELVNVRGEFQQLEIAFETMLKNKAKSDALMAEVTTFAAKTPFNLTQVASGAKQLLAYGEASEDVIGTMRRLGDIAAGLSIPFGDLVYLYGTTRTAGKMMTKDLMQFAGRGIPIIEELSKTLNVSKAEVLEMATRSELKFEHLQTVIQNLTNETGMFGNMMAKQAASLPGMISNLGDAWDQMLNNIGKGSQDTFADAIQTATTLVENYETVIDVLKVIAATYGTYKAAVILNTIAVQGYSKALGVAIIKEKLLAIAQKATPWGLALAGITAVIGAVLVYKNSISDTADKMKEFSEQTNEAVAESNVLFEQLKKTAAGTDERRAAIAKLSSIHGDYITKLNLEKATLQEIEAAQKSSNNELIKKMALDSQAADMKEWFEKELEIRKQVAKAGFNFDEIWEERKVKRNKDGGMVFTSYGNEVDQLLTNYYVVQEEKKKIEELYDKVIKSINTSISKPFSEEDEDPEGDDKKVKTFAQQLEEIRKLYENYYLWAEHYGKESADQQFQNLLKGGQNYLTYLNAEIKKLEDLQKRTPQQDNNLLTLLSEKNEVTGVQSRAEQLRQEIDIAKESYGSLAEYISFIGKKIEQAQSETDGGERSLEIIKLLQDELKNAQKEYVNQSLSTYKELVEQTADFAKKRLLIEKEYQNSISKLDKESLGSEKYDEAVKAAKAKMQQATSEVNADELAQSEVYKALTDNVYLLTRNQMKAYLQALKEQLSTLQLQSKEYETFAALIKKTEEQLNRKGIDSLNLAASLLGEMAGYAESFNGNIATSLNNAGQLLNQFAGIKSSLAQEDKTGAFGGMVGIFMTVADTLDKQFGLQKRIADVQAEHNKRLNESKFTLQEMTYEMQKQLDLMNSLIGVDKLVGYQNSFSVLQNTIKEAQEALNNYKFEFLPAPDSLGQTIDLNIMKFMAQTSDDMIALQSALSKGIISQDDYDLAVDYLNTIKDSQAELQAMQNEYNEFLTGSTYSGVLDGVLAAFEQGLRGAENFSNNFEELMRKAMLQALSVNALQAPLQDWYEAFASMAQSGGGLTDAEIKELRERYNIILESADEYARLLEDSTGIKLSEEGSKDALTGAIKGVSEETAGLIAGQMNAIRINQAQSLAILNQKLGVLNQIETHARNLVYMKKMYDFMVENKSGDPVMANRIEG